MTINIFVFSSLALALICAFVGILRKNQLKQHLSWASERTDARYQTVLRQFSFELNSSRKLWDSASHISVGLTLSIGLFAVGVFILLWTLDQCVAEVVFLFACLTLCVIFSRDLSIYYRRCRGWVRAFQRRLYLASPWHWLDYLLHINGSHVYAGLRPLAEDHFGLLSRAIMSRTSGLTASGVDPNVGRLAQSIVALGRLARDTETWRILTPQTMAEAPLECARLGRVLDIILAILQDRDPLKGSKTTPLSLWFRVKGMLTWAKPDPQQRQLPSYISDLIISGHPWLIWTRTALQQLNIDEQCLLGEIVSDQLAYTLRVTEPLRGSVSGAGLTPEEPLYSAFCLALVIRSGVPRGPSDTKLSLVIALAGMRLQFSNLPLGSRIISSSSLGQSSQKLQAVRFCRWADSSLQRDTNKIMLMREVGALSALFDGRCTNYDAEVLGQYQHSPLTAGRKIALSHQFIEFAVDTCLQAALSFNVTSGLSQLSAESWIRSSQGVLFLMASAHALRILKMWHLESPASVNRWRPEITRLCLRLTRLLRHDLLTSLPWPTPYLGVCGLASLSFPWHGCLERFVDCFGANSEMGAVLRYLARNTSSTKWWLSDTERGLMNLADLFPPNSEADHNLQVIISQHLAKKSKSARQPGSEGTKPPVVASPCAETDALDSSDITVDLGRTLLVTAESSSNQLEQPEFSAALGTEQRAAVHASNLERTPLPTHISNPDGTVPAGEAGFISPNTSRVLDASVPATHAGREVSRIDEHSPHRAIDMLPAAQLGPDVTSPGELVHTGHGRTSSNQDVRTSSHSQVYSLASDDVVVGDDQGKCVDRAHSSGERAPSV
jgi:hypothetical protein